MIESVSASFNFGEYIADDSSLKSNKMLPSRVIGRQSRIKSQTNKRIAQATKRIKQGRSSQVKGPGGRASSSQQKPRVVPTLENPGPTRRAVHTGTDISTDKSPRKVKSLFGTSINLSKKTVAQLQDYVIVRLSSAPELEEKPPVDPPGPTEGQLPLSPKNPEKQPNTENPPIDHPAQQIIRLAQETGALPKVRPITDEERESLSRWLSQCTNKSINGYQERFFWAVNALLDANGLVIRHPDNRLSRLALSGGTTIQYRGVGKGNGSQVFGSLSNASDIEIIPAPAIESTRRRLPTYAALQAHPPKRPKQDLEYLKCETAEDKLASHLQEVRSLLDAHPELRPATAKAFAEMGLLKEFVLPKSASKIANVHVDTVFSHIKDCKIDSYKIGPTSDERAWRLLSLLDVKLLWPNKGGVRRGRKPKAKRQIAPANNSVDMTEF
jgi:hypothetical protein